MSILKVFLRTLATIALFIAQVILSPPANAAPGDLDPTFGTGGKVTTDIAPGSDHASGVDIQSDGRIVVAGDAVSGGTGDDFALARYNADGTLDPGFGTGGTVTTDFALNSDAGSGVTVQPDGKIVVVGVASVGGTADFALARYNPDGTLDTGFGTVGKVTTDFTSSTDAGLGVAVQPDGKIVVAGSTFPSPTGGLSDFALIRYEADGTLDAGFGTGGKVVTDFALSSDFGFNLILQPDGKIVVVGQAFSTTTGDDFALARYNPDGTLDMGFGTGGKVTTDFTSGSFDRGFGIAVQPDGKIVVAGSTFPSPTGGLFDFALIRYEADGTLDAGFGTGGKVVTDFALSSDFGFNLTLEPDGKIVVVGQAGVAGTVDFALARYNPDGTLDTGFGTEGKVTTDFTSSFDQAVDVALQADGRIVVAGSSENVVALARYLEGPSVTEVTIDINPNTIRLRNIGVITVALLTTPDLDATTADPDTVCFGDAEDPDQRDCTEAHSRGHIRDVDDDGDLDLVLHYETQQTGIDAGDREACLTGNLFDGTPIEGCDSIRTR
jgi:uncharacterized delta-60 repeat protein